MCRPWPLVLILVGALFSSGCANVWKYPGRSITLRGELQPLQPYLNMETVWKEYQEKTDKAAYRDEVINAHIYAIDLCFNARAQAELYGRGALEATQDLAGFGLSLASTVSPVGSTKTLLGSIATGIQGGKGPMSEITEHVFFQKSMPVILYKNMELRKKALDVIKDKLKNKPDIKDYPLTEALIDLENYYVAGTLHGALAQLLGPGSGTGTGGEKPDQQTSTTTPSPGSPQPEKPQTKKPK
jgi:hypothetical protein